MLLSYLSNGLEDRESQFQEVTQNVNALYFAESTLPPLINWPDWLLRYASGMVKLRWCKPGYYIPIHTLWVVWNSWKLQCKVLHSSNWWLKSAVNTSRHTSGVGRFQGYLYGLPCELFGMEVELLSVIYIRKPLLWWAS